MHITEERLNKEIKKVNGGLNETYAKIKNTLHKIKYMDIEVGKYHDINNINKVITELQNYAKILTEQQENLRYYLLTKHSLNTVLYGDTYEKIIYNNKLGI